MIVATVDAGTPSKTQHDVVVAFHGRTNSNADVRDYYDLERHAVRPTVFAYPAGLPAGNGGRSWSNASDGANALPDFALFDAIVRELGRIYCFDLSRIFAVGHSLGAAFVGDLACRPNSRLRAIAAVAGATSTSVCSNAIAALLLHNPKDVLVPVRQADSFRDRLIAANNLSSAPRPMRLGDLDCVQYGNDEDANPVVWCPHDRHFTSRQRYYPHQWPRETGKLIMAFFGALR